MAVPLILCRFLCLYTIASLLHSFKVAINDEPKSVQKKYQTMNQWSCQKYGDHRRGNCYFDTRIVIHWLVNKWLSLVISTTTNMIEVGKYGVDNTQTGDLIQVQHSHWCSGDKCVQEYNGCIDTMCRTVDKCYTTTIICNSPK